MSATDPSTNSGPVLVPAPSREAVSYLNSALIEWMRSPLQKDSEEVAEVTDAEDRMLEDSECKSLDLGELIQEAVFDQHGGR